jgi:hypothetical protein
LDLARLAAADFELLLLLLPLVAAGAASSFLARFATPLPERSLKASAFFSHSPGPCASRSFRRIASSASVQAKGLGLLTTCAALAPPVADGRADAGRDDVFAALACCRFLGAASFRVVFCSFAEARGPSGNWWPHDAHVLCALWQPTPQRGHGFFGVTPPSPGRLPILKPG